MPWSLEKRDKKWCVVKDSDGSSAGCHDSRTDAIKQQRALYANESRTAAMYAELDALPDEVFEEAPALPKMEDHLKGSELVKIVVGNEQDKALTASVVQALEATNERLEHSERMTASLAAALQQMAQPAAPPVVNVTSPDVHVDIPQTQVTVEAPQITVQPAEVNLPAPTVTVKPEIVLPSTNTTKTITFDRDFDGKLRSAEVSEQ